jgi:predicted ATPase
MFRSEPWISSAPFVGREPELLELREGVTDVIAGRSRLFLISGEPGIGKTRLAEQLTIEARERGARVIWGRCWDRDGAPAFWPWIQIFRSLLTDTGDYLGGLAESEAGHILRLLPNLAVMQGSSAAIPGPLSSEPNEARIQLFDSAARTLRRIAAVTPLVLILDDLHEADHSSVLMLRFVARELKDVPVLFVAIFAERKYEPRCHCVEL